MSLQDELQFNILYYQMKLSELRLKSRSLIPDRQEPSRTQKAWLLLFILRTNSLLKNYQTRPARAKARI